MKTWVACGLDTVLLHVEWSVIYSKHEKSDQNKMRKKSGLYILYSPDFENPDYKQIYSYVHKLNIFMIWSTY